MSGTVDWDVDKYREEHESEEQWQLRRAFLCRWKDEYPEERLLCLAQVFTNIEFMGCRYPNEVMQEVARLSVDVAKQYRNTKKTKLQRTFVSASDAAEDRARGVKREAGVIVDGPRVKSSKVTFVPQSKSVEVNDENTKDTDDLQVEKLLQRMRQAVPLPNEKTQEITREPVSTQEDEKSVETDTNCCILNDNKEQNGYVNSFGINYIQEMLNIKCLDIRDFNESMFDTKFGRLVLVIRMWNDIPTNLASTCNACNAELIQEYKGGTFKIILDGTTLAQARGDKMQARAQAFRIAWDKLRNGSISLVLKEQWVTESESRISMNDMAKKNKYEFGEPIDDSVALKMMKLMGWKGGGLGADSQGISEPIKPNLRMVRRAGLGHESGDKGTARLRRAGLALMRRRGVALDADLVFAADFAPEERAVLHRCAQQCGLHSKSYGKGADRFLVVTNKMKPFALVSAVAEAGGETAKYRVFIPQALAR